MDQKLRDAITVEDLLDRLVRVKKELVQWNLNQWLAYSSLDKLTEKDKEKIKEVLNQCSAILNGKA